MATVISHNILSPLGETSVANFEAVKSGKSSLRRLEHAFGTPLNITASVFDETTRKQLLVEGCTWFESLVIRSIKSALQRLQIDCLDQHVCLILSTTKANVEWLGTMADEEIIPSNVARKISSYLGFKNDPIVVCNACISGVSALITASRLIDAGVYQHVVVCGCDILGKFIVSGFDALKALSPDECRPFDEERIGLNLGEAAATLVLSSDAFAQNSSLTETLSWQILQGEICNDAYHISTPSPKGIGAGLALQRMSNKDDWAFINLHGTATMYNDQMEWKALEQADTKLVPVNAYKGYLGHTMGAAGILECILSMLAVEHGVILGTRGFHASGLSGDINISPEVRFTNRKSFVKLISGFGGCNAAIHFSINKKERNFQLDLPSYDVLSQVIVNQNNVNLNHHSISVNAIGKSLLTEIYKQFIGDYPRFYKMDILSRLGFVASELVLKSVTGFTEYDQMAVILFNRNSSLCADKEYQTSLCADNYFPSPSSFVYTLPNLVAGEIALRHGIHEETSFYILPNKNEATMNKLIQLSLSRPTISYCLVGWLECIGEEVFEAELKLIKK